MRAHRSTAWLRRMATVPLLVLALNAGSAVADAPSPERPRATPSSLPGPAERAPVPEAHSFDLVAAVASGGGRYVAVGRHGLILTSRDGLAWTTARWKTGSNAWDEQLIGIAWGHGRYLAVSRGGTCLTSADGIEWFETRPEAFGNWSPTRVRWIDGRFHLIGRWRAKGSETTALFSSTDGIAWQRIDGPPDSLTDVAGGNGMLVTIGRTGRVHRRTDDGRWLPTALYRSEPSFKGSDANAIAWNGSVYVATVEFGYGSVLASSPGGDVWTTEEYRGFDRLFGNILWNGTSFVTGGIAMGSSLAMSPDGLDWTIVDVRLGDQGGWGAGAIAGSDGSTLVTTTRGGIIASNDGRTWRGALGPIGLPPLGATRTYALEDAAVSTRSERRERVAESVMGALSLGLITFTMSGIGVLFYIALQVRAVRRLAGRWRWFAWLPVPAMLVVAVATCVDALRQSNLWPLLLIFAVPVALVYLLLLLVLRRLLIRLGRQTPEGEA